MPRRIAKLFLRVENMLVFSRKREPSAPQKDGRLELIGGAIETGENPFEGLLRELEEEETSGLLRRRAGQIRPVPRTFTVNGEPHYLYSIAITADEYQTLRHSPSESYGFERLPKSFPARALSRPELLSRFTPKTRAILALAGPDE